ncbi:hypothetical protein G4B88_006528 [Cannabis sativa]|uniref:CCHC-type domain-containing protein n=1 Tax=Cannabis sativa TaxID=3483 RepID=A0A7J6H4S8_CANSA|nr:hypothetical protein G4B88_006528 [Cannabis sativa]
MELDQSLIGEKVVSEGEGVSSEKGKEVMMDSVTSGFQEMSIALVADANLGKDVVDRTVVIRLMSKKVMFLGLLRNILARKWRLTKGWKLEEVASNTFLLRLTKRHEAELIKDNAPWKIGDGFLAAKPLPEDGCWRAVDFSTSPLWVRVYEIPPRFWTMKNAKAIADRIGEDALIDRMWRNGFPSREYIRFRVTVQLKRPMLVGLFLPMEEGVCLWCYFKYENLPLVCYNCGVIGHDAMRCQRERRMIADDFGKKVPMYGPWMRLGARFKDCFSGYAPYELNRMNQEMEEVRAQEEFRNQLLRANNGFEPALVGTEIHREALAEMNADAGPSENRMAGDGTPITPVPEESREIVDGSLADSTVVQGTEGSGTTLVHGNSTNTCEVALGGLELLGGQVEAATCNNDSKGSIPNCSSSIGPINELEDKVKHLAMVFKSSLDPNLAKAHKAMRPKISRKPFHPDKKGLGLPKFNNSSAGCGKKRRIEEVGESVLDSHAFTGFASLSLGKKPCRLEEENDVSVQDNGEGQGLEKRGWDIQLRNMDGNKIVVQVGGEVNLPFWIGAFVYAPPQRELRDEFWDKMANEFGGEISPWVLIGDLNAVLSQEEKAGGLPVTEREGRGLRNFIFETGAVDIEGAGAFFTWSNGQKWQTLIRERLDRALGSTEWVIHFKKAGIKTLATRHSDHSAIVLDTIRDRDNIRVPFRYYDAWSRQRLNLEKTKITFSDNCCHLLRSEIVNSFGFKMMNGDEQFLGNPLFIHGNSVSKFKYVVDKVANRLEGWKAKLLSQSARSVLIQNVLQTVPLYSMAVFKLPAAIHAELDSLYRRFWWTGDTGRGRYLSLVTWDNICKPKSCGGLGFRKSSHNNICLLAKLAWLLAKESDALWIQVLKGKYFPSTSFLAADKKRNSSLVAKGIWDVKYLIEDHAAWRVSFNSNRDLWVCDWVIYDCLRIGKRDLNPLERKHLAISDLVDYDSGEWSLEALSLAFSPQTMANIQLTNPLDLASQDSLVWTASPSGNFSVKSAYWALNSKSFSSDDIIYKQLWESSFHPRVKLFLWKLYRDALPTGSRLSTIFGNDWGPCCLCNVPDANSTAHLFGACDVVKKLWFLSKWGIRIDAFDLSDGRKVLNWIFNAPFTNDFEPRMVAEFRVYAAVLFYKVWFFRNQAFHNGGSMQVEMMSKLLNRDFDSFWKMALVSREDSSPIQCPSFSHDPSDGFLVEVDAAFGRESVAMGVVVKDQFKQVIAMYVNKCKTVSVIHGELLAALKGIEVAHLLGLNKGVILSDCQALTKAVKAKVVPNWSMASSFSKFLQAIEGTEFDLHWISRTSIRGAHALAKWGLNNSRVGFVSLWEVNPLVFTSILSN